SASDLHVGRNSILVRRRIARSAPRRAALATRHAVRTQSHSHTATPLWRSLKSPVDRERVGGPNAPSLASFLRNKCAAAPAFLSGCSEDHVLLLDGHHAEGYRS